MSIPSIFFVSASSVFLGGSAAFLNQAKWMIHKESTLGELLPIAAPCGLVILSYNLPNPQSSKLLKLDQFLLLSVTLFSDLFLVLVVDPKMNDVFCNVESKIY